MLRYDTDIKHIHRICGGIIGHGPKGPWDKPWIDTEFKGHVSGIPGVTTTSVGKHMTHLTLHSNYDAKWIQHEYSTNPTRTFNHLGIEAARTVWIQEMNRICPSNSSVELLADYMCVTGEPMPCSKRAFKHSNSLRSAAYERAQRVLPNAARGGVVEQMCTTVEAIAFKQFSIMSKISIL